MLVLSLLVMLMVALQQGAPGAVNTTPDGSGAMATALFWAIPIVLLVAGLWMAYSYARRRRKV
jgi:hypothetical protein